MHGSDLNTRYDALAPEFRVPGALVKVICPFRIVHIATGVVLSEGEATFENGRSIVLIKSTFHSVCGPVETPGTLDHTLNFVKTHPAFEFRWLPNEDIRIEQIFPEKPRTTVNS